MDVIIAIVLIVLTAFFTSKYQSRKQQKGQEDIKQHLTNKVQKHTQGDNQQLLQTHSAEFNKKEIIKVNSNVYVAIGYGLANCIMIEGETGIIIIDTLENCDVAREVRAEFEKITKKPVVGVILTHFHADHAHGTQVFIEGRENEVEIYAHETFTSYFNQVLNVRSPITFQRAMRQFGVMVPPEAKFNAGIGLNLKMDADSELSYIYPTKTFSDTLNINIGGVQLKLVHAPGETNDQIIVWYPEKKILFPADNIYKAFPNLYAIRGTMHRDTLQWSNAMDIMLKFCPEILVPQHTRPVFGEEEIRSTIEAYRDAILFVHDQTVRYMNKGLTGREIAEIVKLPPHLKNHPYLIEYYGTVEWSVRAVYHGYMGWFDGRPGNLHPLPVKSEAKLIVELAGGPDRLLAAAEKALNEGGDQWPLNLTDWLLMSDLADQETKETAKKIRGNALVSLASKEVSAPGMNWYLTEEMVMNGLKIEPDFRMRKRRIQTGNIRDLFGMLTCMVDAEKAADVMMTAKFTFTDTLETIALDLRRGVLRMCDNLEQPNLEVTTTEAVWRSIMLKETSAVQASLAGHLKVEPGVQKLGTFFSYLDNAN